MQTLVQQRQEELTSLCRRFHVRRLEVFGSAAASRFDPATSDLDFLITFEDLRPGQYADNYFGLLEALEELFQRPVDVVVSSAITNPYFLQGIEPTRTLVYAA
jgi:predicted nucleotidyltransferase